jgi:hexosaminidase
MPKRTHSACMSRTMNQFPARRGAPKRNLSQFDSTRHFLTCLAVVASLAAASAAHSPLLPRPQEVRYGGGTLPINALSIRFASAPSADDRFTADQLASRLSAVGQTQIPIRKTKTSKPAILLNRTGDGAAVPADHETAGPDSRESYCLQMTPKGVEIRSPSSAGLFYGVQTLLQMVEGSGRQAVLPVADIRDWPALAYRGFMMDFSHGQLLRVSEIERQIDLLARFKANQYYFYSEASIEFEGYELLNPDGRYSRDEVRHIIQYARQRHLDVVPCMELYGHMHDLFRVEKFADLGLPRYGDEFDPRNPRVLAALDGWVAQTAKLFPSPWYHVGFDEPWSLGKIGVEPGKDPFKTFVDVLRHVAGEAQRHGKRLMFWADIMQGASTLSNHPELIRELPAGTIAVPWIYEARTNYAPYVEPLAKENIPTVVAPGIWNWNEIFPDYHRSFLNINGLTAAGKKHKTLGILTTGWTDSAQTIYRQSLPGLVFAAAAGWQAGPVETNCFFADYCAQMYPAAVAAEVAPALEELSTVEQMFEDILKNTTQHVFWRDPLEPAHLARLEARQADLRAARLLAETAQERLQRARRLAPNDPTLNSLLLAARLFDYLGMKSLYAVEWAGYFRQLKENPDPKLVTLYIGIQINAQDHGMIADLMDTISGLREPYREAWLAESTPYRLGTALARWDAETEFWRATWGRVNELLRSRKKDEPFPSIDFLRLKR